MIMVAAGLAGAMLHMVGVSVIAFSRFLFDRVQRLEFRTCYRTYIANSRNASDENSNIILSEILSTLSVFLSSANHEITDRVYARFRQARHSQSATRSGT